MDWGIIAWGCVLLLAGVGVRHWIERRRFYRRNSAGVEEFRDYGSSVVASAVESLATFVSVALMAVGVGAFVAAYATSNLDDHASSRGGTDSQQERDEGPRSRSHVGKTQVESRALKAKSSQRSEK
jgi:hypothetical protein